MSIYRILGILSAVIAATGYIPYLISTFSGKAKPHPFSWLLWSLLGGIVLFFYYSVGARDTLPLAILNFVGPATIFFLSVGYWEGGFSKFDYACLALSLASIVFYLLYHNATVSLSISLVADFFAFLPTFRKSYHDPISENTLTWFMFFFGNTISLFAVTKWTYAIALFPIYMVAVNGINFFILLARRGTLKKAP